LSRFFKKTDKIAENLNWNLICISYKKKLMQTAIIIVISVLSFILVLFGYAYLKYRKIITRGNISYTSSVVTLNDQNFNNITSKGVTLVDFWAEWCQPCKLQKPIINDVAETLKGKARIANIDVEKNQKIAAKYNIKSIPTLIILKNGKEVSRMVGLKNKIQIIKEVEKFL